MNFTKPDYSTAYFSDKIFVKCPKCGKLAVVKSELTERTEQFPTNHNTKCRCNNCGYFTDDEMELLQFLGITDFTMHETVIADYNGAKTWESHYILKNSHTIAFDNSEMYSRAVKRRVRKIRWQAKMKKPDWI